MKNEQLKISTKVLYDALEEIDLEELIQNDYRLYVELQERIASACVWDESIEEDIIDEFTTALTKDSEHIKDINIKEIEYSISYSQSDTADIISATITGKKTGEKYYLTTSHNTWRGLSYSITSETYENGEEDESEEITEEGIGITKELQAFLTGSSSFCSDAERIIRQRLEQEEEWQIEMMIDMIYTSIIDENTESPYFYILTQ